MIDLTPDGAQMYHELRRKPRRTRAEEIKHAVPRQAWDLSEMFGGPFHERDLDDGFKSAVRTSAVVTFYNERRCTSSS